MKKNTILWGCLSVLLVVMLGANIVLGTLQLGHAASGSSGGISAAPAADFGQFCENYYRDMICGDVLSLESYLTDPAAFGYTLAEYDLGDDGVQSRLQDTAYYADMLAQLESFDYGALSAAEQRTYEVVQADLQAAVQLKGMELYPESLTANGFQAMLPVYFLEFGMENADDLALYMQILADVPRYFDTVMETERIKAQQGLFMTEENCNAVIEQCREFIAVPEENVMIAMFAEKLDGVATLTQAQKDDFTAQNTDIVLHQIVPAYQKMIDTLTQLKASCRADGGICNLPQGKAYFTWLMQAQGHSYATVEEAISALDSTIMNSLYALWDIQQQDANVTTAAYESAYPYEDPQEILAYLKEAMTADFPQMAEVPYTVKQVPEVLRPYLSPAFYMTPPLDDYTKNTIYLNIGDGNNGNELFPTLAHEGYPGHLLQFVGFASTQPEYVRKLISPLAYVEGWSSYVETLSYGYTGWGSNAVAWRMNENILMLALYARTDIGINYEGWTREEASEYFGMYFSVDADSMNDMYNRMIQDPAGYVDYGLGLVQMLALRSEAQETLGTDFSAVEFHRFIIETGPCDMKLLQSYFADWLALQGMAAAA